METPAVTTSEVRYITTTTAQCGGVINSDGGAIITTSGVCWSTSPNPSISDNKTSDSTGIGSFISNLTDLTSNTVYYARAYATNSEGTGYGNVISFTTTGTITDIDGNTYNTIKLGDQLWMGENLRVIHYRNGDDIVKVTNDTVWQSLTTGAYCDYDNLEENSTSYGRLYNWYAVNDSRHIAPDGWHVPSENEWKTLIDYLGGDQVAGGKMKAIGTQYWTIPNTGATNESGFSALPGGYRYTQGEFTDLTTSVFFWSSSENNSLDAWTHSLRYDDVVIWRYFYKKYWGCYVRCIKD
jgi:uncharacterized protein (TIGR02145 family)